MRCPNSNSTRNQVDEEPLCGCATSKLLLIIYFILFIYLYRDTVWGPSLFSYVAWNIVQFISLKMDDTTDLYLY